MAIGKYRYFMLYKPFGMLSQFTKEVEGQVTLADLDFHFPVDVYPVGRLDADSEGLLLLTNDKSVNARLLDPKHAHKRTYWAQVEGEPTDADLDPLRKGVTIRIDGKDWKAQPVEARVLPQPPEVPERIPPIRFRKSVPDAWIELTLTEGKNRQVRRMCAAIGFPVLRLVRVQVRFWHLGDLQPGEVLEISKMQ